MDKKDISILLVDDDEIQTYMLRCVLERKGYSRVDVANSGEEAILKAKTAKVIIMDTDMNGMPGYKACGIIKGEEYGKKIGVLGLSGALDSDREKQWMDNGADCVFPKPYDFDDLPAKVEELARKYCSK